ncbi:MAG: PilZ domain-containing protein [Myxococcales bacterium]|nr:PilZ domain-containing protein [Myxococcales bacterium]
MVLPVARRERRSQIRDFRPLTGTMKYQGTFYPLVFRNIGLGGALVSVDSPSCVPTVSDGVNLTVDLGPLRGSLMLGARVRSVSRSGIGLEFVRFYSRPGRENLARHLGC